MSIMLRRILFLAGFLVFFNMPVRAATFFGEKPSPGLSQQAFNKGNYLLYVPSDLGEDYSLVILAYVYWDQKDSTPEELIQEWIPVAEQRKFVVAVPFASAVFETFDGWFEGVLKSIKMYYPVDRSKILLSGFGEGGHYALYYGLSHPNAAGALAIVEGAFEGPWKQKMTYKMGDKPRLYFLAGGRDNRVSESQVQAASEKLQSRGYETQFETMPEARHEYAPEMIQKVASWFEGREQQDEPQKSSAQKKNAPSQEAEAAAGAKQNPENPNFNFQLQKAYVTGVSGQQNISEPLFKELLNQHPQEWIVYDFYTQILQMAGRLQAAKNIYGQALKEFPDRKEEIEGRMETLNKVEKFAEEMKTAPPWEEAKTFGSNAFTIQSNIPEIYFRSIHDHILEFMGQEMAILKSLLGEPVRKARPIKVSVFGRIEEYRNFGDKKGTRYVSGAYYDPDNAHIVIYFDGATPWESIAHELSHALLHEYYIEQPSMFVDEGLAMYLEYKLAKQDIKSDLISNLEYLKWLDAQGELEHAFSLFKFWQNYGASNWSDSPLSRKSDFYLISWSLVHFFIEGKDPRFESFFRGLLKEEQQSGNHFIRETLDYFDKHLSKEEREDLDFQWGAHFLDLTPETV